MRDDESTRWIDTHTWFAVSNERMESSPHFYGFQIQLEWDCGYLPADSPPSCNSPLERTESIGNLVVRRKSQLGVSEVARVMKCHDVMNQCIAMTHVNLRVLMRFGFQMGLQTGFQWHAGLRMWPCTGRVTVALARYTELSIAVSSAAALGRAKDFRAICRVHVWDDLAMAGWVYRVVHYPCERARFLHNM